MLMETNSDEAAEMKPHVASSHILTSASTAGSNLRLEFQMFMFITTCVYNEPVLLKEIVLNAEVVEFKQLDRMIEGWER